MTGRLETVAIWTQAEKDLARQLWCDGADVDVIRKALAKAGFPKRSRASVYDRRKTEGWPERGDKRKIAVHTPVGAKAPGKRRLPPPRLVVSNPGPADAGGPGVHLFSLRASSCRWPLWDDKSRPSLAGMRFCGEPAMSGSSYCAACAERASGGRIDVHLRPEPGFRLAGMRRRG